MHRLQSSLLSHTWYAKVVVQVPKFRARKNCLGARLSPGDALVYLTRGPRFVMLPQV